MSSASTSAQRADKHRAALRVQGLQPIQIRVPDTRAPGFVEECARQAAIVDEANGADPDLSSSWTPPQPTSLSTSTPSKPDTASEARRLRQHRLAE